MNAAAANSLLKVLEEPPVTVYFILVSDAYRRLLPTIRSRCTRLDIGLPPLDLAVQWLAGQGVRMGEAMGSAVVAEPDTCPQALTTSQDTP